MKRDEKVYNIRRESEVRATNHSLTKQKNFFFGVFDFIHLHKIPQLEHKFHDVFAQANAKITPKEELNI